MRDIKIDEMEKEVLKIALKKEKERILKELKKEREMLGCSVNLDMEDIQDEQMQKIEKLKIVYKYIKQLYNKLK